MKKYPDNTIGLIGHSIINYPSPELAMAAVGLMAEVGVDLIELQIPFSEPIADGPVFMAANHAALAAGVTVKDCFNFMQQASAKWQVPLVFMTYANIIYKQGFAEFVAHAKAVGAKGAIVPDLPIDMAAEYLAACEQQDFAPVQVIPPNVSDARLKLLTKASKGFVYAVARTGVTGAKRNLGRN
ncbi:MAG: tryptophan synthase subunit alpha [Coxiellaceae bacterium]|nr:MAG: tryptophan synthase subunit alpha [Coxiellaceae bacterium]